MRKRNTVLIVGILVLIQIITVTQIHPPNTSAETTEITTYQDEINQLQNTIEEQNKNIQTIQTEILKIKNIQTTSSTIDDFTDPDYDSGWIPLEPGNTITLTHKQGVKIFVHILGWDSLQDGSYVIHQNNNGEAHWDPSTDESHGITWCSSNDSQITLCRGENDRLWDEFRIFIWQIN